MRRLFYALLSVALLWSCGGSGEKGDVQPKNDFKKAMRKDGNVEVNLKNPGYERTVYLRYYDPDKFDYVTIDSVKASTHFALGCDSVKDGVYALFIDNTLLSNLYNDDEDSFSFEVEADGYAGTSSVKGNRTTKYIAEYNKLTKPYFEKFKQINNRYNSALDGGYAITPEDTVRLCNELETQTRDELTKMSLDFMKKHEGEFVELYVSAVTEPACNRNDPEYLKTALENYWNHVYIENPKITMFPVVKERVGTYISVLSGKPEDDANKIINAFLDKCESNPRMFRLVTEYMSKVFGDKSQPVKQHFIYVNVLERIIASDNYTDLEKEPYRYKLSLARNHLPGTPVASMDLKAPNGMRYDPTKQPKKWQVYFFFDPDCSNCGEAVKLMNSSDCVRSYEHDGELQIYAIYVGKSEEEWRKIIAKPEYNNGRWINLWDDKGVILKDNIYDLGALPMIYLIDRNKKVSVKDIPPYDICNQLWHKGKEFGENLDE